MSDQNTDIAYVRKLMIAPSEPPMGERGAIKWARENLFSGWFNSILTVLSLILIVALLVAIFPWFANAVWHADSLDHCREILKERAGLGEGDSAPIGACFAVITERWQQLLYGFYPQDLYWRANMNLLLLFVALVPILFTEVTTKTRTIMAVALFVISGLIVWGAYWSVMGTALALFALALFAVISYAIYRFDLTRNWMLVFSAIYPFLLIWLVWGGSIWGPVGALMGFVIMGLAGRYLPAMIGSLGAVIVAVLAAVIWWLFLAGGFDSIVSGIIPISIQPVESRDLGGFMVAIIIGISGIVLSLPIGVVLALGRQSDLLIVHTLCVGFIEFIRGVPLITLLFTASLLLNYFLPPGTNFDIILRVIIMVTLFSAAYMAETIRGGLAALPKGQYEAADSLGLDYWKAQRLIIMPQALKISIPGIVNNFIGLFKDTTLVTFIGILDILNLTNSIRANAAWHGIYWELYIFVGFMFFISCFPMGRYSKWLEAKLATDHR